MQATTTKQTEHVLDMDRIRDRIYGPNHDAVEVVFQVNDSETGEWIVRERVLRDGEPIDEVPEIWGGNVAAWALEELRRDGEISEAIEFRIIQEFIGTLIFNQLRQAQRYILDKANQPEGYAGPACRTASIEELGDNGYVLTGYFN